MEYSVKSFIFHCFLFVFCANANAGWFDQLLEQAQQTASDWLATSPVELAPLTPTELLDYPPHYRFQRVREGVHHSPLFFLEAGSVDKPTVILVHGLGEAASKDWLNVIPALEVNYHVYAIDLPGFGLSKGEYFKYSPHQYSEILRWFIAQYCQQKPIVVGHSMGAAVSLYFAATYPEQLQKLVLVDAAGILERTAFIKHLSNIAKDNPQLPKILRRLVADSRDMTGKWIEYSNTWYDPTLLIKDNPTVRETLLASNGNANAALALVETDFSQLDLTKVGPTQLIWGEQDPVAPIRTASMLLYRLPQVQLHAIREAGHVPMKSHPKQFNQLLLKSLENPPQDTKPQPLQQGQVVKCSHDDVVRISGSYQQLILENCKLAELNYVTAQVFSVRNSIVHINNSELGSLPLRMKIVDSTIVATATQFNGTLELSESRVDMAGVNFNANEQAVVAISPATLLLSLTMVNSPQYKGPAHGFFQLEHNSLENALVPSPESRK